MKPKLIIWDVVAHMNNVTPVVIEGNEVAVIYNESGMSRLQIQLMDNGEVVIYKSGTYTEHINITVNGSNKITIK